MRHIQRVLFIAIAMLYLAAPANADPVPYVPPVVTVGNYNLLPNTPGQMIPFYVTGIVPNDGITPGAIDSVQSMILSAAINNGGVGWPQYGGTPGPKITGFDALSGPSIWVPPNSLGPHYSQTVYLEPQLGQFEVFPVDLGAWVNVTGGLFGNLIVDTTGFTSGTYSLKLSGNGGIVQEEIGPTTFHTYFEPTFIYQYFDGTAGQITIVPEPSSVVLATIGLIGLAAWGWRRKR